MPDLIIVMIRLHGVACATKEWHEASNATFRLHRTSSLCLQNTGQDEPVGTITDVTKIRTVRIRTYMRVGIYGQIWLRCLFELNLEDGEEARMVLAEIHLRRATWKNR
jgi:hypothetical protein